ncbi:uncharacterized protein DEA37_0010735, partial [Paragonimus westermani]
MAFVVVLGRHKSAGYQDRLDESSRYGAVHGCVLLCSSKGFNRVGYSILLRKLNDYGLGVRLLTWLGNHLARRCWIVTGGFHLGIMKLTGEAVRDYTDAYGGNRMMAFGVASWDCVLKNELLEAALHE